MRESEGEAGSWGLSSISYQSATLSTFVYQPPRSRHINHDEAAMRCRRELISTQTTGMHVQTRAIQTLTDSSRAHNVFSVVLPRCWPDNTLQETSGKTRVCQKTRANKRNVRETRTMNEEHINNICSFRFLDLFYVVIWHKCVFPLVLRVASWNYQ